MTKNEIIKTLDDIAWANNDTTLNIEAWYNRIKNSTGDSLMLAQIFDIPVYLVEAIKNCEE